MHYMKAEEKEKVRGRERERRKDRKCLWQPFFAASNPELPPSMFFHSNIDFGYTQGRWNSSSLYCPFHNALLCGDIELRTGNGKSAEWAALGYTALFHFLCDILYPVLLGPLRIEHVFPSIQFYGSPPGKWFIIQLKRSSLLASPLSSTRGTCSQAREEDSRTVVQPCIWCMEEPSQFSMSQTALFHHGETTYRVVGWMSENPTLVL